MTSKEIRIGDKPIQKYVTAILYTLDENDIVVVASLGSQNDKAYNAVETAQNLRESIEVLNTDTFEKDDKIGVRIKLKCPDRIHPRGVDFGGE